MTVVSDGPIFSCLFSYHFSHSSRSRFHLFRSSLSLKHSLSFLCGLGTFWILICNASLRFSTLFLSNVFCLGYFVGISFCVLLPRYWFSNFWISFGSTSGFPNLLLSMTGFHRSDLKSDDGARECWVFIIDGMCFPLTN